MLGVSVGVEVLVGALDVQGTTLSSFCSLQVSPIQVAPELQPGIRWNGVVLATFPVREQQTRCPMHYQVQYRMHPGCEYP